MSLSRVMTQILIIIVAATATGCTDHSVSWVDVTYREDFLQRLQQEVDQGHLVGNLDPKQVAMEFVHRQFGAEVKWLDVRMVDLPEDRKKIMLVGERESTTLILTQPIRKGPTGIWIVERYARTLK